MNFTSEVWVPALNLPPNTEFDRGEGVFIWNNEGSELFFDRGEPVLFRVEQEEWIDQKPTVVRKNEDGDVIDVRDTSWRVIVSFLLCRFGKWSADDLPGIYESGGLGSFFVVGHWKG